VRAYAHLNLTRNPFGEATARDRARLAVADLAGLREQLRDPGFAVQVVGDCGHGKTTHLLALRAEHPDAPFVRVDPGERPRIPPGSPLFLDEAQHLPSRRRRRLFREHRRSFALGTHVDLKAELEAAGLTVHTIRPAEGSSPDRLDAIFRARIEWARRGPGPVPVVPRRTIATLLELAGADVRTMEGLLYSAIEDAKEIGDVEL
jgi:hypothetical protein